MTDTSPDVARLAGAVTGLFDGPILRHRPPVWRAWTPDGLLLLFESEHEDVARRRMTRAANISRITRAVPRGGSCGWSPAPARAARNQKRLPLTRPASCWTHPPAAPAAGRRGQTRPRPKRERRHCQLWPPQDRDGNGRAVRRKHLLPSGRGLRSSPPSRAGNHTFPARGVTCRSPACQCVSLASPCRFEPCPPIRALSEDVTSYDTP